VIIKKQEGTKFELGSKTGNGRYHNPQHYKTIFVCTGYGSFILSDNGHSLNCFLSSYLVSSIFGPILGH